MWLEGRKNWWEKILYFSISLVAQDLPRFFKEGTESWERRILFVVCQSELSVVDKDTRCLVKFSDLIEAKSILC